MYFLTPDIYSDLRRIRKSLSKFSWSNKRLQEDVTLCVIDTWDGWTDLYCNLIYQTPKIKNHYFHYTYFLWVSMFRELN